MEIKFTIIFGEYVIRVRIKGNNNIKFVNYQKKSRLHKDKFLMKSFTEA